MPDSVYGVTPASGSCSCLIWPDDDSSPEASIRPGKDGAVVIDNTFTALLAGRGLISIAGAGERRGEPGTAYYERTENPVEWDIMEIYPETMGKKWAEFSACLPGTDVPLHLITVHVLMWIMDVWASLISLRCQCLQALRPEAFQQVATDNDGGDS